MVDGNAKSARDSRYPQVITADHFEQMRDALYPSPPEGFSMVGASDRGDDTTLTFRLSGDLKAAIHLAADAFELPMGEFCRRAVASVIVGRFVDADAVRSDIDREAA